MLCSYCGAIRIQNLNFAGTGFFVGEEIDFDIFIYLVTAKHVVVGIKQKSVDGKVYIRINDNQGGSQLIESSIDSWSEHPTDSSVDVSVLRWAPSEKFDYIFLYTSMAATDEVIRQNSIGIGDEVFIAGMFVSHKGKKRNIPIVRVGNISAMPEEKIDTPDFGSIEAYLIEARSIGGLSGSPVFVNVSGDRTMGGNFANGNVKKGDILYSTGNRLYLLGLIYGHWDEQTVDDVISEDAARKDVNMGMAMVVPATKILEIIDQPKWVEERQLLMKLKNKKHLPVQDALPTKDSVKPAEIGKDGIMKEEFEDVLKKISRPLNPDDQEKKGT